MQNRRYFDDALKEYIDEFRRIDRPVGLIILDLDHFKAVNDTYGHDVGDEVLKSVAGCLREMTRYHDVAARLGGEEFAVVAPNLDDEQLHKLAERIRKGVAAMTVQADTTQLSITTSVGVAVWNRRESCRGALPARRPQSLRGQADGSQPRLRLSADGTGRQKAAAPV